ncbi:hypothetical protein J6590_061596 [Homalodisca vitripennis]|nr:hypothetical protein J6590_061596 [Homalodisca vitripennis]
MSVSLCRRAMSALSPITSRTYRLIADYKYDEYAIEHSYEAGNEDYVPNCVSLELKYSREATVCGHNTIPCKPTDFLVLQLPLHICVVCSALHKSKYFAYLDLNSNNFQLSTDSDIFPEKQHFFQQFLKLRFPSSATGLAPCYVIKAKCAACLVEVHLNTAQRNCVFLGFVILRSVTRNVNSLLVQFHLLKKCTVFIDMNRKRNVLGKLLLFADEDVDIDYRISASTISNFDPDVLTVVKDKIEHVHLPPQSPDIDWKQKAEEFWLHQLIRIPFSQVNMKVYIIIIIIIYTQSSALLRGSAPSRAAKTTQRVARKTPPLVYREPVVSSVTEHGPRSAKNPVAELGKRSLTVEIIGFK